MDLLSVAVCDDNILECVDIERKLKTILTEMNVEHVIHSFHSGQELLVSEGDYDIIFLDIIMQKMNGMQTAEVLRKRGGDSLLIFITASRTYVFEAYDVEAFHYLLKPIDDLRLRQVLKRAVRRTNHHPRDYYFIQREQQKVKLFLEDIYYFESRGRQIEVHGTRENFSYYEQIGVLERALQGRGFFRCHKCYLLNLSHVERYNRQEAFLDNGESVLIAKRRYDMFCNALFCFMQEMGGSL